MGDERAIECEARIAPLHGVQRLSEEAGRGDQRHRDRDLPDDEHAIHELSLSADRAARRRR